MPYARRVGTTRKCHARPPRVAGDFLSTAGAILAPSCARACAVTAGIAMKRLLRRGSSVNALCFRQKVFSPRESPYARERHSASTHCRRIVEINHAADVLRGANGGDFVHRWGTMVAVHSHARANDTRAFTTSAAAAQEHS